MDSPRLVLCIMGPQLLLGFWVLLGRWWNCRVSPSSGHCPVWPVPFVRFAQFFLCSLAIAYLLPWALFPLLERLFVPRAAYAAPFLTQCVLALFLLAVARWGAFSFGSVSPCPLPTGRLLRQTLLSYLAMTPVLFLVTVLWTTLLLQLANLGLPLPLEPQNLLLELENAGPGFVAAVVAVAVIAAPIGEEILFRGGLYRFLRSRIGGRGAALVSSLLFALLHWNLNALVPLFVLGLVLTRSYGRGGNLLPCIGMHALFNLSNIALTLLTFR